MGRRGRNGLPWIASAPWPIGIGLGIAVFLLIRFGLGDGAFATVIAPMAWVALLMCWLGALASYVTGMKRKQLIEAQTGLDSLGAMSWREFEMLVGEAFRRRGWHVEETGQGGADGGVDLILSKGGRRELVQCKQWRSQQVGVAVIREMWGLASHHGVDGIKIVSLGTYTDDAAAFSQRKPIELINGAALLGLIRDVQLVAVDNRTAAAPASTAPACPRCGTAMVERRNRLTNEGFWGCRRFPKCRGSKGV